MVPFLGIIKRLREDIRGLPLGLDVTHRDLLGELVEGRLEPLNAHIVCAAQMSKVRVFACFQDSNGSRVVLHEEHLDLSPNAPHKDSVPEIQGREADCPQGLGRGDNLGFRCAM